VDRNQFFRDLSEATTLLDRIAKLVIMAIGFVWEVTDGHIDL
jgi:hypothetical protein